MKTTVYIATSLDGFIARKNGGIDWLFNIENPTNDDYGYSEFISGIDAIVMGRNTFEVVRTFNQWPYEKIVFVLSTSLKKIPDDLKDKASLLSMEPKQVLSHLSDLGYSNLYIDGGKTIQRFLRDNLIDEIIVTKVPVLLGDGIPLFGFLDKDVALKHIDTIVYPNGLVKSHYQIIHINS